MPIPVEMASEPFAYQIAHKTLHKLGRLADYPFVAEQLDIEGFRLRKNANSAAGFLPHFDWFCKVMMMAREGAKQ